MPDKRGKVVTEAALDCCPRDAWNKVCFYEHVAIEPSLFLRVMLPVPQETTGRHERVGDLSRCCYSDGGFLTKRIVEIVEDERLEFCIVEQSIRYHRFVRLLGGRIEVEDAGSGRTIVRMTTNYETSLAPAGMFRWAIARVVKAMHSIVVKDMQACLTGAQRERNAVQLQA